MKRYHIAVLATALITMSPAYAIDLGHGMSFKTYGTLGIVNSDNEDADYVSSRYVQAEGAGLTDNTSYKVDSKLGAQFNWQASDRISLTAQLLSKQYEDKTWTPRIEAANIKFNAASGLDVRVGRIRPAIYMLSDFLDVNYANPWVRPPVDHYAVIPFSYMDGVDLLWRTQTGEVSWLVQPYIGQSKSDTPFDYGFDNDIFGINAIASQGDFTIRVGYMRDTLQFTGTPIDRIINTYAALCAIDPKACTLEDDLRGDDLVADYVALGGSWDNGDYFVSGEMAQLSSDDVFILESLSWYLTAGTRIESWTPYIVYSSIEIDDTSPYTGSSNAITNAVTTGFSNAGINSQNTLSLGVRYDFMPSFALKAQWDHVETDCNEDYPGTCGGIFTNKSSDFSDQAQEADIVSLSIDFVF